MNEQFLFASDAKFSTKLKALGNSLFLDKNESCDNAYVYRNSELVCCINLKDKTEFKISLVDLVEIGAKKSWLCQGFGISRQSLHNYIETKKRFGSEGLIHNYHGNKGKGKDSIRKQRKENAEQLNSGNTNDMLREQRRKELELQEKSSEQQVFNFCSDQDKQSLKKEIEHSDQVFAENHDWEPTRYAGVFVYIIALFSQWKWIKIIQYHYGEAYKIFMIFIFMAAQNIRSIEGLKNVFSREAGVILGIKKIPSKPMVWSLFYKGAVLKKSAIMLASYFNYQIKVGLVCFWIWASDGHLLPYTGKEKVRRGYNTQRRLPVAGRTNTVTCDEQGRIVDFVIEEGKGDLKQRIIDLNNKYKETLLEQPMMVFDRECYSAQFFYTLIQENISFCTWEKNIDSKKLKEMADSKFTKTFEKNGKTYGVCEEIKKVVYTESDPEETMHEFVLRKVIIWNKSSNRRACGLAWTEKNEVSMEDCARAILSRWGASENTFKHIVTRHPYHYHPGFKLSDSPDQEITNPLLKEIKNKISILNKALAKHYKKLSKKKIIFNADGTPRKNNSRVKLEKDISEKETQLEQLKREKSEAPQKVDTASLEDYKSIKTIDNEGKNMFDFATTSIWNARKLIVNWLLVFYTNKNEVVDLFYAIAQCHGRIKSTPHNVFVQLEPLEQKKRRMAQESLCRKLTSLCVQIPCGKILIIEVQPKS